MFTVFLLNSSDLKTLMFYKSTNRISFINGCASCKKSLEFYFVSLFLTKKALIYILYQKMLKIK